MATKNLLGGAYRFEPGNGKRRDAYLAKLGIETFLVVSADSVQSKNGGMKKIKFNTDPFATLPRMNTPTSSRQSPPLRRMNSESKKTLNDSDSSSLDSLYEKVPPSLPVILFQRNPPTASLPHIYAASQIIQKNLIFFFLIRWFICFSRQFRKFVRSR